MWHILVLNRVKDIITEKARTLLPYSSKSKHSFFHIYTSAGKYIIN